MNNELLTDRHPSTQHVAKYFEYNHLPPDLQATSAACSHLAEYMITKLEDGPELSAGLRKLLEAKDCFVRAMVDANKNE